MLILPTENSGKIFSVDQVLGEASLRLGFDYALEGYGKPDSFKVLVPADGQLWYTIEDMKEALIKVVSKVEKRLERQSKKNNQNNEKSSTKEIHPDNLDEDFPESKVKVDIGNIPDQEFMTEETEGTQSSSASEAKSNNHSVPVKVTVYSPHHELIPGDCSNHETFSEGNKIVVSICNIETEYDIQLNPPTIRKLELPRFMLVGLPNYPQILLKNCDIKDCDFIWYRSIKKNITVGKNSFLWTEKNWKKTHEGFIYTPTQEDIGSLMRVVCVPKSSTLYTYTNQLTELADFEEISMEGAAAVLSGHSGVKVEAGGKEAQLENCEKVDQEQDHQRMDVSPERPASTTSASETDVQTSVTGDTVMAGENIEKTQERSEEGSRKNADNAWDEVVYDAELEREEKMATGQFESVTIATEADHVRTGKAATNFSKYQVREPERPFPFERRHLYMKSWKRTPSRFSVLTYNILADKFANTKSAIDELYFYCPPMALNLDYRKQLFMQEILGFETDIVCLQEVDQKTFIYDLMVLLPLHGYEGCMKTKFKTMSQGEAVFYKKDKFSLVANHTVEAFRELTENKALQGMLNKVKSSRDFWNILQNKKCVLQVVALQPLCHDEPESTILLVVNLHLSCGPKIPQVRLIQLAVCLHHLQHLRSQVYADKRVAVVLCGDLNDGPMSGLVQLLKNGQISAECADWFVGGRPKYFGGCNIDHPFCLKSAYNDPLFTNFVAGFCGTLDYIFLSSDVLQLVDTVPLPSEAEVREHTALPSVKFPSDHVSLIAQLEWR